MNQLGSNFEKKKKKDRKKGKTESQKVDFQNKKKFPEIPDISFGLSIGKITQADNLD